MLRKAESGETVVEICRDQCGFQKNETAEFFRLVFDDTYPVPRAD